MNLPFDPNLRNTSDATGGASHNSNTFRAELWKENTLGDSLHKTFQFSLTDQGKKCHTGLTTNHGYHVRIKKNVFVNGQLMGGSGVVSYA